MTTPLRFEHQKLNRLCPFIHKRNPLCFCVNLDSQKISQMADYCMTEYEKCPHYKKLQANSSTEETRPGN